MTKIFTVPFAENGDKISPPDAVQPDGSVSYNLGYGFDYQRDTSLDSGGAPVDPLAKVFPREQHNGILNDITTAIGEMQINGLPIWQSIGSPYPVNALVRYSGSNWRSTAANNSTTPGAPGSSWVDINYQPYSTEASAGVIRISTAQQALDWSDDFTAMTPIKVKASMDKKLPFVPVQQGGGVGQGSNKLNVGWDTLARLRLSVDGLDFGAFVLDSNLTAFLPKRAFTTTDYIRIPDVPGGLIIQWAEGVNSSIVSGGITIQSVSLPVSFPNAAIKSFVTTKYVSGVTTVSAESPTGSTLSSVSVTMLNPVPTGTGVGRPVVLAIGY